MLLLVSREKKKKNRIPGVWLRRRGVFFFFVFYKRNMKQRFRVALERQEEDEKNNVDTTRCSKRWKDGETR